jgi:ferredoxin-NADP reductase
MNQEYILPIRHIEQVTHDVKQYRLDKPANYQFTPGQATEVAINKPGWKEERRPFTFTSLNDDPYLEFTIKSYTDHPGVTNQLSTLDINDELIVHDVWGAIEYKGPGYFIAGGAGITPFIAILRQLKKDGKTAGNTLFFSNKTENDIIIHDELSEILGQNAIHVITDEPTTRHMRGFINEEFLKKQVQDFNKNFYVCGPPKMVEAVNNILIKLGAKPEAVVFEK